MDIVSYLYGFVSGVALMLCIVFFVSRKKHSAINQSKFVEQERKISELNDEKEDLKRRLEMDVAVKLFETNHTDFVHRLTTMAGRRLTRREIFLCMLIAEGKHSSSIAKAMFISETSVEIARHRLRAKLNLEKNENLHEVLKRAAG